MATIQGVYVALFGRPADPIGLSYWKGVTNDGKDLSKIMDLAASPEYQQRFTGMSNTQIVNSIYVSLFGHDADVAGLTFWVNNLNSGAFKINDIAIRILDGAQGSDKTIAETKVAAADKFTAQLDTTQEILAYNGTAAADLGRAFVAGVTTTVPTDAQVAAAVDTVVKTPGGLTTALTTAVDNLPGTAGNDIFSASVETIANGGTLNNGDVVDGGAGTDTFNITVVDADQWAAGAQIKNVENIYLRSLENKDLTFATVTGAKQVWSNASSAALSVTNLQNNVTVGLKDTTSNFTASFAADKVGSATATLALATSGSTATVTIDTNGGDVFTKATVDSSGAKSAIALDAGLDAEVELKELAVTGNAALTLTAASAKVEFDGLTKLDASAMTAGGITIDLTGNATATTKLAVTGSGGDDTFTFATADLTTDITANGGAGKDALVVTGTNNADSTLVSAGVGAKFTNFEVLRAAALTLTDDTDLIIDASVISGLSEVQLQAMTGTALLGASTANVTNLSVGSKVTFLGSQGTDLTNTLTFKAASLLETTRGLTVELGDGAGVDGTKNGVTVSSLNVSKVTDLTINSVGGTNAVTAITTTDLKNLVVTGDKALTISPALAGDAIAVINASGMTVKADEAGLTMTLAATNVANTGLTITGSAGADVLRAADEGTVGTTFNASTGADTYYFDNGSAQKITYSSVAQSTAASKDTIATFNVTEDVIDIKGLVKGAFVWKAGAAFDASGNTQARFVDANTLQIDTDGNGAVDMTIDVTGVANTLTAGNFLV